MLTAEASVFIAGIVTRSRNYRARQTNRHTHMNFEVIETLARRSVEVQNHNSAPKELHRIWKEGNALVRGSCLVRALNCSDRAYTSPRLKDEIVTKKNRETPTGSKTKRPPLLPPPRKKSTGKTLGLSLPLDAHQQYIERHELSPTSVGSAFAARSTRGALISWMSSIRTSAHGGIGPFVTMPMLRATGVARQKAQCSQYSR
jgi:hypothetical protein